MYSRPYSSHSGYKEDSGSFAHRSIQVCWRRQTGNCNNVTSAQIELTVMYNNCHDNVSGASNSEVENVSQYRAGGVVQWYSTCLANVRP
jgi:hypothetical protein